MTWWSAGPRPGNGGHVLITNVTALSGEDGWFTVERSGRAVTARRLLVATGLRDEFPRMPGLAELWGTGVPRRCCSGSSVRR